MQVFKLFEHFMNDCTFFILPKLFGDVPKFFHSFFNNVLHMKVEQKSSLNLRNLINFKPKKDKTIVQDALQIQI